MIVQRRFLFAALSTQLQSISIAPGDTPNTPISYTFQQRQFAGPGLQLATANTFGFRGPL